MAIDHQVLHVYFRKGPIRKGNGNLHVAFPHLLIRLRSVYIIPRLLIPGAMFKRPSLLHESLYLAAMVLCGVRLDPARFKNMLLPNNGIIVLYSCHGIEFNPADSFRDRVHGFA